MFNHLYAVFNKTKQTYEVIDRVGNIYYLTKKGADLLVHTQRLLGSTDTYEIHECEVILVRVIPEKVEAVNPVINKEEKIAALEARIVALEKSCHRAVW